ncbi:unnamed protein product [Linum trigynum]|uniref:Fe2OG dioxygenase domain-containing protein n=1 Tax=Linum trigynum TaxID=586398 RepID=A0AAV2DDN0_9ROSI
MAGISGSGAVSGIPVVDLSTFLAENDGAAVGDEIRNQKKKAIMEVVKEACSVYGFFQIVNHGVPLQLMDRAFQVSAQFFDFPLDEKLTFGSRPGATLPAGYNRHPFDCPDKHKNDYLFLLRPSNPFFVAYPAKPPHLREVAEEVFTSLIETGSLIEGIINDSLGLPCGLLKQELDSDSSWDFMLAHRYFPEIDGVTNGLTAHEDSNAFTLLFQDDVGGLEVWRNGEWIPVTPEPGAIVVNVGDLIQVLSNNKFKSATHRVVRPKGKSRYSYTYFHSVSVEKLVEPLPQFTEEVGELPKYRKFRFGEYLHLKKMGVVHPPERPEDIIHVTHYSIN